MSILTEKWKKKNREPIKIDAKKRYPKDIIMVSIDNDTFYTYWINKLHARGYDKEEILEELLFMTKYLYENYDEFSASMVTRKAWKNLHRRHMKRLGLNHKQ